MNEISPFTGSRRTFLKTGGKLAAASALAGVKLPYVHASNDDTLRVALIGAGGRGTGAAHNALSVTGGPIKLVAMADVNPAKLQSSLAGLTKKHPDAVDVPPERQFIGFDAYQQALECLRPSDVAIFTTPCAFRWVHFGAAVERNVHVFMEKPLAPDGPSARKMYELGEKSARQSMKVAVGLMCRHAASRQELKKRIDNGEIGDPIAFRCYRMQGSVGSCFTDPMPAGENELLWQISKFHAFLWLSGGSFSDYMIHNIDECCMMRDKFPVRASALGGRHYREGKVDQNFDHYSVEYVWDDGIRLQMNQRNMQGCKDEFASYVHGSKGIAVISTAAHAPAKCKIFKGHELKTENLLWAAKQPEPDPYQVEWEELVTAIRQNTPYNEVKRSVDASLTCVMGRMAAHTGQEVTWEDALNCEHQFGGPDLDKLTAESPSPLRADAQGLYPVPQPGINKKREY